MAVTLTWDAPLSMGTKPRDLFLRHEPSGPVLALVESFPGAMSPLRSKELYDLILSLHPSYKSQDERKSGANHWRFSVHAETSRSIPGFSSRIEFGAVNANDAKIGNRRA